MNVLSLFDGMSCGQLALKKAGIEYRNYFVSEVDKYAIKVSSENFPDMIHLGDVTNIDYSKLPKIDLLIGGSPCQGFSFAGKKLNFEDPRSKLFFEFVKALEILKPKYFMLENVNMKKGYQDIISSYLECCPIRINSNIYSAQNRDRLYWTNIPTRQPFKDKNTKLSDILENNKDFANMPYEENYVSNKAVNISKDKFNCLRASAGSRTRGIDICIDNGMWRKLTVLECKRLQTVPDDYKMNVSNSQAYKMLGNGWTVDVIAHIFKGIKL